MGLFIHNVELEKILNKTNSNPIQGNKPMKKIFLTLVTAFAMNLSALAANTATDNASSTAYDTGWAAGSNGGSGFQAWTFNLNSGTTFRTNDVAASGSFIGDSTQNGRDSINSSGSRAFGLYANVPNGSEAFVSAYRKFQGGALTVGQTFSIDYSQSWNAGNRGINLLAGGSQVLNLGMGGGSDALSFGGNQIYANIFNEAIRFAFEVTSSSEIKITFTPLNSTSLTTQTATAAITALPDEFQLYYSGGATTNGSNSEPFFNNLSVVPEPSTPLLMGLGLAGLLALRKTRKA